MFLECVFRLPILCLSYLYDSNFNVLQKIGYYRPLTTLVEILY